MSFFIHILASLMFVSNTTVWNWRLCTAGVCRKLFKTVHTEHTSYSTKLFAFMFVRLLYLGG